LENPTQIIGAYDNPIVPEINEFLKSKKFEIEVLDLQLYSNPWKEMKAKLNKFKPEFVGITSFTIQADLVGIIANFIKKFDSSIITIYGGVHASALPEKSLKDMGDLDYIVIGEGEITLLELCAFKNMLRDTSTATKSRTNIDDIKGIAYRNLENLEKVKLTAPRPLIKKIDLIPMPARHKIELLKYKPLFVNYFSLPTTGILGSRGCPYNCGYCSKAVFKQNFRFRSPENVLIEMEYCEKHWGIKDFRFFDDSVTSSRKWIINFCKLLIKKNKKYYWNAFTRVDTVSKALLKLMKKAGCYHLKFGVETASEKILKMVHKFQKKSQVIQAIQSTKNAGIEAHACFMLNFPDEDLNSIWNTINFAKSLNPTYLMFSLFKPLPGSELYEIAKKGNQFKHEKWGEYGEEHSPVLKNQVKEKIIMPLLRKAYNICYIRPEYWIMRIREIVLDFKLRKIQRVLQGFLTFINK
jgi:radical SAM superfamily enzyme YgiQ (UPF0313 family)